MKRERKLEVCINRGKREREFGLMWERNGRRKKGIFVVKECRNELPKWTDEIETCRLTYIHPISSHPFGWIDSICLGGWLQPSLVQNQSKSSGQIFLIHLNGSP